MPVLYVVATPIGNLGDMTPRAIETLKNVALIAAEDTRVTSKLLHVFDIHTPLISCHEHNERSRAAEIVVKMLAEEIDVAVTTDAGTPCISDPGTVLAAEAIRAGITVLAVPGPTAMASAISVSGFDAREFAFYGFLPREKKELKEKLRSIADGPSIGVVHESPHRVENLLEIIEETLPNTRVSASCDLTKKYEATIRGSVHEVLAMIRANPKADKGEYCIVLEFDPADRAEKQDTACSLSIEAQLFDRMIRGIDLRDASDELAASGLKKNAVKTAALNLKRFLENYE